MLAHRACQNPDGTEDLKKGTQLLEVYALEIQMYTEQKNTKKLKSLYHKALYIKSAIPHPRIMGIIRECGGKMHMHERIWSEAATDFFEVRQGVLCHWPLATGVACYCLQLRSTTCCTHSQELQGTGHALVHTHKNLRCCQIQPAVVQSEQGSDMCCILSGCNSPCCKALLLGVYA